MLQPPFEPEILDHMASLDAACVQALNRLLLHRPCTVVARLVSRRGDGELWGALIVVLALLPGGDGLRCALHLFAVGLAGVLVYAVLKRRTARPRPCACLEGLLVCSRPLDEFSFPSGHALHAVSFAIVALAYFPALGFVLLAFALLTALVRVVLGLHYPSDVLAGVAVGAALAGGSLWLVA